MGYTTQMPKGVYDRKPENYPPSRKGTKLTEAHKLKIVDALKGNTWNRGRKHSKESSVLKSQNSAKYWSGKVRGPQSEETVAKRSVALKGKLRPDARERWLTNHPTKGRFGSDHPRWVEEKKRPVYKAIRQLHQYKEWRMAVFTRDNFMCVLCQSKGYIEADHYPIRFVDILRNNKVEHLDDAIMCQELWETSNGRALCKPCHLQTNTWGRRLDSKRGVMR